MAGWFDLILLPPKKRSIFNIIENFLHIPRLLLFKGTILDFSMPGTPERTAISPPHPFFWALSPILLPITALFEILRLFIRPLAKFKHPKEYAAKSQAHVVSPTSTTSPRTTEKREYTPLSRLSPTVAPMLKGAAPTVINIFATTEGGDIFAEGPKTSAYTLQNTILTQPLASIAFSHELTNEEYLARPERKKAIDLIRHAAKNPQSYTRNLLTTPNNPDRGTPEADRHLGFPSNTPLQLAVKAGDLAIAQMLLPHYGKEDLLHASHLGNNALHVAIVDHHWGIAELILQRAAQLDTLHPELHALDSLLQSTNIMGWTPMQLLKILSIKGKDSVTFTSQGKGDTAKPLNTLTIPNGRACFLSPTFTLNTRKISGIEEFYAALFGGEEARKDNYAFVHPSNSLLTAAARGQMQLEAAITESPSNMGEATPMLALNGKPCLLLICAYPEGIETAEKSIFGGKIQTFQAQTKDHKSAPRV